MSTTLPLTPTKRPALALLFAAAPALAVCAVVLGAWSLAALAPIGFSIATVFLFAGPHNWFEARYMLQRMPARWGPLTAYFTLGIAGTIGLTLALIALGLLGREGAFSAATLMTWLSLWFTLLIGWIVCLALFRARQNPRREWTWLVPVGFMAVAGAWLWPLWASVLLVYLHPLVSLWFLDRELARQRSTWLWAYRMGLALLPLAVAGLWVVLARAPNLPGDDVLSQAIASHAGGNILTGVSTHLLVATHTFLEMLHYGVWIVAIPLIAVKRWPWQLDSVPLARRSLAWRRVLAGVVASGAAVMLLLWVAFAADYPLTRDVYFLVATLHVLAEVPFLLRLL